MFEFVCYFLMIEFRLCIVGRKIQKSWCVPLIAFARWYVILIFLITGDVNFNFFIVLPAELKYLMIFFMINQYFRWINFNTVSFLTMIKYLFIYLYPYKHRDFYSIQLTGTILTCFLCWTLSALWSGLFCPLMCDHLFWPILTP